jgi:hypothetical protein
MRRTLVLLALAGCALFAGCLQRVDADLPTQAQRADALVKWVQVGKFGGNATISVQSTDPYAVRYAPGGFVSIAGVCATEKEVWVCDLGVSRIQVFDFNGNYLRAYGAGVPIKGTLVTDERLLYETQHPKEIGQTWEKGLGQRWVGAEREFFKVADVQVTPTGYWAADQVMTTPGQQALRSPGVYFVPFDGGAIIRESGAKPPWQGFIGLGGSILAASVPTMNHVELVDVSKSPPRGKSLGSQPNFLTMMQLKTGYGKDPMYIQMERKITGASADPAKFNHPCGVAVAFEKVVICDMYNHRLQVFDGRNRGEYWGRLLRVISPRKIDGSTRFDSPQDIDISANGQVFVLDAARDEVALLSSDFERLGSFARKEIALPWALDLSDDGRHCFITDQRTNTVYHYAAQD